MGSPSETTHVLYVDDEPNVSERCAAFLRDERGFITTTATGAEAALAALAREPIDCVVSEYDLPDSDGLGFLDQVRERDPDLPFVLFTGRGNERVASRAFGAGVSDYLPKDGADDGSGRDDRFATLADRVTAAVEEYRARQQLAERNRRLETLTSNLPGIVYRCENAPGWPMSYVAGECEALVGYAPETIESDEVSWGEEIIHPEDRERAWDVVQEAIESGEPFELTYRVHDSDGDVRWLWERGRAVTVAEDGVAEDAPETPAPADESVALEGFITDVTERKERERALREEREFTETMLDTFDDIVYVFDAAGNFIRWNDRATAVSGYTEAELTEMGPTDVVADEHVDKIVESIGEIFETGRSTVKADLVMADGSRVPYEFRGRALTDEEGEPWGFCGVARDITERKQRERELEARNERLDEFASVVSHDLRNPLNVAEGHLELAAQECDSDHLDAVAGAHDRMDALIEDLLTLAREDDTVTDPDPAPLETAAEQAWHHVETPDAALEIDDGGTTICADESRLQRLLENLVRNAVEHGSTEQAGDDGAGETDAVEKDDDGAGVTVTVGTLPDGAGFYVADDGPGIPPDERDRMLEAGATTNPGGTGFGLAIVRRIAEAHDWEIELTESDTGGLRVEFRGVAGDDPGEQKGNP
jgi:PAS domain S-box-containing protein